MPPTPGVTPSVFWEKVDEQTLAAPAGQVTFSGLDAAFTFFRVTGQIIGDPVTDSRTNIQVNNDAGANYDQQVIDVNAASVAGSSRQVGVIGWRANQQDNIDPNGTEILIATIAKPLAAEEAQSFGLTGWEANTVNAIRLELWGGEWPTASLLTRIDVVDLGASDFDPGTRILLEGGKPA